MLVILIRLTLVPFVSPSPVVDCGSLSFPANGEVMVQETTFGFTATYTCNPGFVLFGFSARVCQITGDWSGDEPTCRRKVLLAWEVVWG